MEGLAEKGHHTAAYTGWRHVGFESPWIGIWSSRGILVPSGLSPLAVWERYYASREEKLTSSFWRPALRAWNLQMW